MIEDASKPEVLVIDDETLALDVVGACGPGGSMLSQAHTRRHAPPAAASCNVTMSPNPRTCRSAGLNPHT